MSAPFLLNTILLTLLDAIQVSRSSFPVGSTFIFALLLAHDQLQRRSSNGYYTSAFWTVGLLQRVSTPHARLVCAILNLSFHSNFTQFYSTKSERDKKLQREYETQMEYRKHLQAFIDRWRYNANRGTSVSPGVKFRFRVLKAILFAAAQAQSKIKILEKLPELEPPEADETETFRFVQIYFPSRLGT